MKEMSARNDDIVNDENEKNEEMSARNDDIVNYEKEKMEEKVC